MEDWEKELREKLNKELEHGGYQIGVEPFIAITGKGGYIDFQVMLQKEQRHKKLLKLLKNAH